LYSSGEGNAEINPFPPFSCSGSSKKEKAYYSLSDLTLRSYLLIEDKSQLPHPQ
jgi:hypothetical protein